MKILCLIDSLSSGGAERQMSYLCAGLKNAGNDVVLAVFSDIADFYRKYIEDHGVEVRIIKEGFNKYRRPLAIINLVSEVKPDAVISYKDGVNMAACIARAFKTFKLIVSERNTTQILSKKERLKFWLYRFAQAVVPNSFSQGEFIKGNFPSLRAKVHVITNMIDTAMFHPADKTNSGPELTIITTARVMPQKNVLRYLDAIKILKDKNIKIRFKWYGAQLTSYYDQVKQKISELKLEDTIQFFPPEKDVAKIYHAADIFCLPSVYEGFPNVVCEAMACGLPVVCSNICDNPYIVKADINGFLFDPYNAEDIAESLEKMVNLPTESRHQMSVNNANRIKELCSQKTFIDSYLRLINSI